MKKQTKEIRIGLPHSCVGKWVLRYRVFGSSNNFFCFQFQTSLKHRVTTSSRKKERTSRNKTLVVAREVPQCEQKKNMYIAMCPIARFVITENQNVFLRICKTSIHLFCVFLGTRWALWGPFSRLSSGSGEVANESRNRPLKNMTLTTTVSHCLSHYDHYNLLILVHIVWLHQTIISLLKSFLK